MEMRVELNPCLEINREIWAINIDVVVSLHIHGSEVRAQIGGLGSWLILYTFWQWVPHLQKSNRASSGQKLKENHNPKQSSWPRDFRMNPQLPWVLLEPRNLTGAPSYARA